MSGSQKYLIWFVVVAVIVLGGVYLMQSDSDTTEGEATVNDEIGETQPVFDEEALGEDSATNVYYEGEDGVYSYSPSEVVVKAGESVSFVNNSDTDFWPASAFHPTHTNYPESDIAKCGVDNDVDLFDACVPLAPGGTFTFVFNEVGTWGYHDHLNSSATGKIVVE